MRVIQLEAGNPVQEARPSACTGPSVSPWATLPTGFWRCRGADHKTYMRRVVREPYSPAEATVGLSTVSSEGQAPPGPCGRPGVLEQSRQTAAPVLNKSEVVDQDPLCTWWQKATPRPTCLALFLFTKRTSLPARPALTFECCVFAGSVLRSDEEGGFGVPLPGVTSQ